MTRARRKHGKSARRARAGRTSSHADEDGDNPIHDSIPRSLVIHRGRVGRYVRHLERDLRRVMQPHTAMKLKVQKKNNIRDFVVNGVPIGVTHLVVLTMADSGPVMRMIRLPHGPTITFRVEQYTLAKDVVNSLKRPFVFEEQLQRSPLVVMSGFDGREGHVQLVQTFVQNMFPAINVDTVSLASVRRCLLLKFDATDSTFHLRHYAIKAVPAGFSKSTRKLMQTRKVPDLGKYDDISQFFLDPGQLSESEVELDQKEVELSQDLRSRGCKRGEKSNLRLVELGPRLHLQLLKIEEQIDDGQVLYHSYINKSPAELARQHEELNARRRRKEKMRKENEHRVIRRLKAIAERRERQREIEKSETERVAQMQAEVVGEEGGESTSRQHADPGSITNRPRYEDSVPAMKRGRFGDK